MITNKYNDYCAGENEMVDTPAIKEAMSAAHVNQHELAELIGVSYHTIRNRLKYGNWTVLEAFRVSKVLEMPMDVFFAYPEKA